MKLDVWKTEWKRRRRMKERQKKKRRIPSNISIKTSSPVESSDLGVHGALQGPWLSLEPLDWGDVRRIWKPCGILYGGALTGPESCLLRGDVNAAIEKTSVLFQTWSHKARFSEEQTREPGGTRISHRASSRKPGEGRSKLVFRAPTSISGSPNQSRGTDSDLPLKV